MHGEITAAQQYLQRADGATVAIIMGIAAVAVAVVVALSRIKK